MSTARTRHSRSRSWLAGFGVAAIAALSLAAASSAPAEHRASPHQAGSAQIRVAAPVRVATRITIFLSGFPVGEQVRGTVQPRSAAGGNGVGRVLFKPRTVPASGSLRVRVRFPRSYFRCSGGAGPCSQNPFVNGERVIISVASDSEYASVVRRVVVPRRR